MKLLLLMGFSIFTFFSANTLSAQCAIPEGTYKNNCSQCLWEKVSGLVLSCLCNRLDGSRLRIYYTMDPANCTMRLKYSIYDGVLRAE